MRPWTHRRWHEQLGAYVDRELPAARRVTVGDHLDDCPGCRDEVSLIEAVKASLRRVGQRRPEPLAAPRLRRFARRFSHVDAGCG